MQNYCLETTYRWIENPQEAQFLKRLNRFACLVELEGTVTKVYLPNTGRLEELLLPGAKVLVEKRRNSGKTLHDLLLVQTRRFPDEKPIWVVVDSRQPPALLRWAIEKQLLESFGAPWEIREEPSSGEGRFDLMIHSNTGTHIVETKSVNLLDSDGVARFPDAPTDRGIRHLKKLIEICSEEVHPWLIFIVMREDATAFSPFRERDPLFSETVTSANEAGVRILALKFKATIEITYQEELDILLPGKPFNGFWPLSSTSLEPS